MRGPDSPMKGATGSWAKAPAASGSVRLALFGTFYPESGFVGTTSTGFARALSSTETVGSIVIFGQRGSIIPRSLQSPKLRLLPIWSHDDGPSLLRAALTLILRSREFDAVLFNTFLTGFGRKSLVNALGLLIPPVVALVTGRCVIVYMHNFMETQDVAALGYRPKIWDRVAVRIVERLLFAGTTVVVPLRSQRESIRVALGRAPVALFIPYAEAYGLDASTDVTSRSPIAGGSGPARILLLGTWGPQKDLRGVLAALQQARDQGANFVVSVTGSANLHFPDYQLELDHLRMVTAPPWLRFLGHIPESELLEIVRAHDLMILPYNESGGYSSAMGVGSYCELSIISYDISQLRETAEELSIKPVFVPKGDVSSLATEIVRFCATLQNSRAGRSVGTKALYNQRAIDSMEQLLKLVR
jgi:glycosyltransferase involved in cell wall biosynthesis